MCVCVYDSVAGALGLSHDGKKLWDRRWPGRSVCVCFCALSHTRPLKSHKVLLIELLKEEKDCGTQDVEHEPLMQSHTHAHTSACGPTHTIPDASKALLEVVELISLRSYR